MSKYDIQEAFVSELSDKGLGIATLQSGKVCHVVNTLPQERAYVRIIGSRKRRFLAEIVDLIEKSADRQNPKCPHFTSCGGCTTQHMSYDKQLQYKFDRIKKLFSSHPSITIQPIIASPPWHYRNKMEFTFSQNKDNARFLGLIGKTSRRTIHLSECSIAPIWTSEALRITFDWWSNNELSAYFSLGNRGLLQQLYLRESPSTGDRMIIIQVNGFESGYEDELAALEALFHQYLTPSQGSLSLVLRKKFIQKGSPTYHEEILLSGNGFLREKLILDNNVSYTIKINPDAFFQPNTHQSHIIYAQALKMASLDPQAVVYDLYSGIGSIGLLAASFAKAVYAIESNPAAIAAAKENAIINGVNNIHFLEGDVAMLSQIKLPHPDVIFLDPPRSGIEEKALAHIIALKAPSVIYISCNPATQVRDIAHFIQAGYTLQHVQPIDQFPHTMHVENIAYLKLESQ